MKHAINYSVIEEDGIFDVFENRTKQTISTHTTRDGAHALKKRLNLGAGFDGNTPAFFLNSGPLLAV